MAAMEELLDQLGGGGVAGVAIATVVLAPAVFPPVRRGLRGLAKAAIIHYLRVTTPGGSPALDGERAPAVVPEPDRPRRRARATAPGEGGGGPAEAAAPAARPRRGAAAGAAPLVAAGAAGAAAAPRGRPATPAPVEAEPVAIPERETPAPAPPAGPPGAEAPSEAPARAAQAEGAGAEAHRVNLNTATRGQLMRLPRIGAQAADRIIEFREQQGPIRNLRQLRQADVIPVAAARQIRELVRF